MLDTRIDRMYVETLRELDEAEIETLVIEEAETEDDLVAAKETIEDALHRLDTMMEYVNSEIQFRNDHGRQ